MFRGNLIVAFSSKVAPSSPQMGWHHRSLCLLLPGVLLREQPRGL